MFFISVSSQKHINAQGSSLFSFFSTVVLAQRRRCRPFFHKVPVIIDFNLLLLPLHESEELFILFYCFIAVTRSGRNFLSLFSLTTPLHWHSSRLIN